MLGRNQIITDLWNCGKLNTAIRKMKPTELQDDLRQELFLELLRIPDEKLTTLHENGQLSRYAFGIIRHMILTNRSAFYNTHRRFSREMYAIETDPADNSDQTAPLIEHIDATFAAMDNYESGILKEYLEMGACKPVAEATGIKQTAVQIAVTNAKTNFKRIILAHAF